MDETKQDGVNGTGDAAASSATPNDSKPDVKIADLSLTEINDITGKGFKDKETALKAIKDTFGYVGEVGQLRKEVTELKGRPFATQEQIAALQNELFYKDHPEFKPYEKAIAKLGASPSTVVASDEFKEIFGKVVASDKSEKLKSVLETNPKLAAVNDKMGDIRKSVESGNMDAARSAAAKIAIEAFDLNS